MADYGSNFISPADQPIWALSVVKRYTDPNTKEVQFDGGTSKAPARRADNPTFVGTQPPAYLNAVVKALSGIRESLELSESVIGQFKKKHVQGLHHYTHFEGPHGTFAQIKNTQHHHSVYQDKQGKQHTFNSYEDLKAHIEKDHALKESLDEAAPPWLKKKSDKKKEYDHKDGDKNHDGKPDKHQDDDGDGDYDDADDNVEKKLKDKDSEDQEKDDDSEENENQEKDSIPAPVNPAGGSVDGSELKQSLEQLALQAAELYAEVDDKQSFSDQAKAELDNALEALGKVKSALEKAEENDEDQEKDAPGNSSQDTPAGQLPKDSPNPPTGVQEAISNLVKGVLKK
ncbi:hypothetical protein [Caulobacter phage Cr30]|uniref:hypothetical protein n=1 Tax=Caulobacter phage Cr30 TaxID=1357714 RepID=UPI0004A9B4CA|nr:hypothetical protein OZ74_gp275 [Caulobacter phage Cr30]AGS81068.1 hypothetical protein [Caulobacter phage Cr30]